MATYAIEELSGSITIRVIYRFGSGLVAPLPSTVMRAGVALVALMERYTSPLFRPIQTMFEFPRATAIAEILSFPGPRAADQVGVAALTFVQRQSDRPPPPIALGVLRSSTKGAIKFALVPASARPLTMYPCELRPPSIERWIWSVMYSP